MGGGREENDYTRKLSLRGTISIHQKRFLLCPEFLRNQEKGKMKDYKDLIIQFKKANHIAERLKNSFKNTGYERTLS